MLARSAEQDVLVDARFRVARDVEQRALVSAVSSTVMIARTAGGSLGGRRRCGGRVSDLLLHRRRGGQRRLARLGQPGSRLAPFPTSGAPDEAAERRRRPSCGERPATKLLVSSSAFQGYLGGFWGPTDGRTDSGLRRYG